MFSNECYHGRASALASWLIETATILSNDKHVATRMLQIQIDFYTEENTDFLTIEESYESFQMTRLL